MYFAHLILCWWLGTARPGHQLTSFCLIWCRKLWFQQWMIKYYGMLSGIVAVLLSSVLLNDSMGRGQDGFRFGVYVPGGQKFNVKRGCKLYFFLVLVNQRRSQCTEHNSKKCWPERICVWRCVLMGEVAEALHMPWSIGSVLLKTAKKLI